MNFPTHGHYYLQFLESIMFGLVVLRGFPHEYHLGKVVPYHLATPAYRCKLYSKSGKM